eukprot:14592211-Ditylum_brightwellii.AAC.1
MAKQKPLASVTHSGKRCSIVTGRKGQYTQINNNGIDLENKQCGLCAAAANITKRAKKVAAHQATKAA